MSSFRCLYIESDNPEAAMQMLSAVVGGEPAQVEAPEAITAPALLAPVDDEPVDDALIDEADDEPAPPPKKRRKYRPAPAVKGGGSNADRAYDYLVKAGTPMRRTAIADACGIKAGSITPTFRDPRFVINDDRTVWLANGKAPAAKAKVPVKSGDSASHHAMIHTLVKSDQPLELKEIARITKIPEQDCFKVLQGEVFEKIDGLYWIAK